MRSIGAALLAMILVVGCVESAPQAVLDRADRYREVRELPPPSMSGTVSVERALQQRRSVRDFSGEALLLEDLSQLLWAAQGITDASGHRTAPSAGAAYPIEIYALTEVEVMHYLPEPHQIEVAVFDRSANPLGPAAFDQDWIESAPVVLVLTGAVARTNQEYGAAGERLMDREAGHVAQNVLLEATALGLAAVPVGGFDPGAVRDILLLPPGEEVLYLLPVGHPAD